MNEGGHFGPGQLKRTISWGVLAVSVLSLLVALAGPSKGAVSPGSLGILVQPDIDVHENSSSLPVFGFGATSSSSDTLSFVEVSVISRATAFSMSDLEAITTDMTASGIGLYRDSGSVDDSLDPTDTAVSISSVTVPSGSSPWKVRLNISSESVPSSVSGSYQWLMVARTSSTIGQSDAFQLEVPSSGIGFSDGTRMPSSASRTGTMSCIYQNAHWYGSGTHIPIGEDAAPVDTAAVQAFSIRSGISQVESISAIELELIPVSGFDPWTDLKNMDTTSSSGIRLYFDNGGSSPDTWDPAGDGFIAPSSVTVTNISSPSVLWKVRLGFPTSGTGRPWVPTSSTGSHDMFIIISTSNSISNNDRMSVRTNAWSLEYTGLDGKANTVITTANSSRQVRADTLPPNLTGTSFRVTSDRGYFYEKDTDLTGRDEVFYNSVSGEGLGQILRFMFQSFSEDNFRRLTGETAFGQTPSDTDPVTPTIGYVVSNSPPNNPLTLTLEDTLGHITIWDVYVTEDNTPPRTSGLSLTDGSPYIHTDLSLGSVLFRNLMVSPHPFHISGSSSEPTIEAGLNRVTYSNEPSLHSSPPTDDTPASFNGTYEISSISTSFSSPLYVDVYDNVQNRNRLQIVYSQLLNRPVVTMVTPSTLGQGVSGLYRVTARVNTPAPTLKVEFSTDGVTGPLLMAYGGTSGGLETYYHDWETVDEEEGPTAIVVKATDRTGGVGYNTTYWVNVNNYPLWGYFENLIEGDSRAGRQTLRLRVSSYCRFVQLYVDDTIVDSYSGTITNGRVDLDLDTRQFTEGVHVVKAYLQGFGGRTLEIIVKATFDNTAPHIGKAWVDYPGTQTAARAGDNVRVKVVISDNVSGLLSQRVFASSIGGSASETLYDDGSHDDGQPGDGLFATNEIRVTAPWAFRTIRVEVQDKASNQALRDIRVPVDTKSPLVESTWVKYPVGQGAAKPGDNIQVMARASDSTAPVYITLVLDNSGSMSSSNSIKDLKKAANTFVNSTRSIDYLAIYRFRPDGEDDWEGPPGSPKRILNFTLMNDAGKKTAQTIITGIVADAGTPIWDAIGDALDYTINNGLSSPMLVAFTDGADDYTREWGDGFSDPIRFEEGSYRYAPWHNYGTIRTVNYHWGKYPDNGYMNNITNQWVSNGTGNYYWVRNPIFQDRSGLLYAPIPVFTIGLALEHHEVPDSPARTTDPMNYEKDNVNAYWEEESGTPEYNLWRIAKTSSGGDYFYAPSSTELEAVFKDLAGSIYTGVEPAKIISVVATLPLDMTLDHLLYDDGLHSDAAPGDGLYGTEIIQVPDVPEDIRKVLLLVQDWANNSGYGDTNIVLDTFEPRLVSIDIDYGENRTAASDWEPFVILVNATDMGSSVRKVSADATALGFLQTVVLNDTGRGNDRLEGDGIWTSMDILPSTGDVPSMRYPVEVEVLDQAGNMAKGRTFVKVINDELAPVVQMVHPRSGGFIRGKDTVQAEVSEDGEIAYVKFTLKDMTGAQVMSGYLERNIGDLFSAEVDSTNRPEGMYIFELVAVDSAGRTGSSGLLAVGIDNNDPSFYLRSPTDSSWVRGVVTYNYTAFDTYLDDVYYSVDGGQFTSVGSGMDTRLYSEGPHDVEVKAQDRGGRYTSIPLKLFFDNTVPQTILVAPADSVAVNGSVHVEVLASDPGGIQSVEGRVYLWGNRTTSEPPREGERPVATVRLNGPKGGVVLSGQFEGTMDTRGLPDGKYLFTGTAVDRSGTEGHSPIYLPVDNNPPEVLIVSPRDGGSISGTFKPQVQINDPFLVTAYYTFNGEDRPISSSVDLNEVPEGAYTMRFVALDSSFRSTVRTITVYVDRTAPVVKVLSPPDRMTFEGELLVLARVQEASGVKLSTLLVDSFTVAFGERLEGGDLYRFKVDISGFNRSAHRLEVIAEDMAGRTSRSGPITFYNVMFDSDSDGVSDPYDDSPLDPRVNGDIDGDGFGSFFDLDDDGDGILDEFEPQRESLDPSGNLKGFVFRMDPTEWSDTDSDGIGDNSDPDIDGDGYLNDVDRFPLNVSEWGDVDGDGIGDNKDPDIDGDGVRNRKDRFRYDPKEWKDTDKDGVGNNADNDDDGDGVPDDRDAFPENWWRRYHWEPYLLVLAGAFLCTLVLISGFIFRERLERGMVGSWEHGKLMEARRSVSEALIQVSESIGPKKSAERKGPGEKPSKGPPKPPQEKKEKVIDDKTKGYRIRWERP